MLPPARTVYRRTVYLRGKIHASAAILLVASCTCRLACGTLGSGNP